MEQASPNYVEMIENTCRGHQFLKSNFGIAPKGTWQIDPFGHTNTQVGCNFNCAGLCQAVLIFDDGGCIDSLQRLLCLILFELNITSLLLLNPARDSFVSTGMADWAVLWPAVSIFWTDGQSRL